MVETERGVPFSTATRRCQHQLELTRFPENQMVTKMSVLEKMSQREPRAAREDREDRLTLIHAACHVFHRGGEEAVFTLKELRGACRFLSHLIGNFDRAAGDLCLLTSHAETWNQFESLCRQSRRQ